MSSIYLEEPIREPPDQSSARQDEFGEPRRSCFTAAPEARPAGLWRPSSAQPAGAGQSWQQRSWTAGSGSY
ncbi:hypothetical protein FQA47_024953 [Oryzias melastigma]|uniref:Uncharacterized protein n=1 Tax=Oryzias melastigma TaxID=30732 RepID=A0A834C155_ORYME|nr:hypothetical protein FQA47_024953 [Oryzias melastigma]